MPRETKEQRLKRQLDEAMDINRNAAQQLVALRAARDEAQLEREMAKTDADSWRSTAAMYEDKLRKGSRRLFGIIFELHLKNARHEGYIQRVTDLDGSRPQITGPAEDFEDILGGVRSSILNAPGETARDRILDGVDTDTLDQVLGKAPEQDRFLHE